MALPGVYNKMALATKPLASPLARPAGVPPPPSLTAPTAPPTGAAPPSILSYPQGTPDQRWQQAQDWTEANRNFVSGIRNDHMGEVYGGPQNVAALNDTSGVKLPTNMPDYYGMLSDHTGGQHDLFNDEASAQAFLARARQSDPNAHLVYGQQNGGGGEGGSGINEYYIDWDNSKMPGSVLGKDPQHIANVGNAPLFNRNMSAIDPHYGVLTDNRNIDHRAENDNGLMNYAPMVVAGIATVMSGGAASPAVMALMNSFPQLGQAISSGNVPWSTIMQMAASAMGAPSWASSGAGYLANAALSHGGKG